ncbi:MAG: hypothetical protein HZB42_13500 [Sphingobacteriales bacterium]|nr:hypothetical protein [Sphingobacteriales bacterium]
MKVSILVLSVLSVLILACNKDKFQTKPSISIKSISTDKVPLNSNLVITLECTDKEGDVQDSVIVIKNRLNKRVVPTVRDTLRYTFPFFPVHNTTEIVLTMNYQDILSASNPPFIPGSTPPTRELDTLILKLAVRDNAGHTSDTITTKQIYVVR